MEPRIISTEDVQNEGTDPSKDLSAYWYAWGRMDAGEEPVVICPALSPHRDAVATAWLFGATWSKACAEVDRGRSSFLPGIPAAWDNFVLSGGRNI